MQHSMIDIETLSTKPGAVILSIGAVKFDPYDPSSPPYDPLYMKLDLDEQVNLGRDIDDDTVKWWGQQAHKSPAVYEEAFSEHDRVGLDDALAQLSKWAMTPKMVWGQGYGFDMNQIESLYASKGKPVPWLFWQIRDSRTFLSLYNIKPAKENTTALHNALADADMQAICVQRAFKLFNDQTENHYI